MKLKLGIIYGILIWFFVYLITVIFSPLITDNIPYINIVAPIAIITVTGFFGILYIRDINENEVIEGFYLWFCIFCNSQENKYPDWWLSNSCNFYDYINSYYNYLTWLSSTNGNRFKIKRFEYDT